MTPEHLALIANMEAKARAATPGRWGATRSDPAEGADVWWLTGNRDAHNGEVDIGSVQGGTIGNGAANAAHIASADPTNILTLITIIREQAAAMANGGWQPIETAPNDGRQFLVWNRENGIRKAKWYQRSDHDLGISLFHSDGVNTFKGGIQPTHWHLLPTPSETTHAFR